MEEEKVEEVKLEVLQQDKEYGKLFGILIDAGLITQQGLRIQGVGIVIKKLDEINKTQDKTNLKIWQLNKDIKEK